MRIFYKEKFKITNKRFLPNDLKLQQIVKQKRILTNCEFVGNMYFIRELPCITKAVENKVKGYKKIGKKFRNVWFERDASRGFSL